MSTLRRLLIALGTLFVLTGAQAWAEPAQGDGHGAEHAEPHGGGHGEAGHDGEHGDHHYYTDDNDGDGIPNWRDSDDGTFDTPETYVVSSLIFHAINLAILLGVIFYAVRRPVGDLFRDRARQIRADLTDSARQRDEANQRHQELVARLEKIQGEVDDMAEQAKVAAANEEANMVERAQREATRIAEQATRSIRDETTRAKNVLRREAVELAVKLAEDTLRNSVASDDQRTLAQDFLDSLQQEA